MFNRIEATGITPIVIEINVQNSIMNAITAAYRNDILLPGVVLVGIEASRHHMNGFEIVGQDGKKLSLDDRRRIADKRRPLLLQDNPDFSKDSGEVGTGEAVHMDRWLPKTFRVVKAKELELKELP